MSSLTKPIATALLLALTPCCTVAQVAGEERRAYVRARAHGWVEITLADLAIPPVAAGDPEAPVWVRPVQCSLSVELDGEPWFTSSLYPQGESAPYFLQSGFRFPAPVGPQNLRLTYSGCRATAVVLIAPLLVQPGTLYELVFDGSELDALPARPDREVSLEDIYEAVTGRRSPD